MSGKRPKERKCYVLRAGDGTVVEVTREVYLEWYQSRRRERYQREKERKYQVSSLEMLTEQGAIPIGAADGVEDTVIREICTEKLRSVMEKLAEEDAYLLYLLYFEEVTVKEAAQICGCSRKTIANRRKRILKELNGKLREMGIIGGCF
ncbi:sigma-70 family RNA polymerase sigma factor [Lachnospiraceae bacterium KGMB03038]|uniref:RNA polymerase sigma factor n=1 Tax=Blautia sp. An81 TaxID=1965659 RepID=UPI000B37021F|nr:sigma-70 family RNA polymerase sigma factor [Blautia sp. An81]OUN25831.1 RNA polymerase subunit sigma-70 [Blautia sp. An81]QDW72904.1 sigma-70 family RNA polymerase sigma factor [Lachnospiraceae bacterium KGMB03038]